MGMAKRIMKHGWLVAFIVIIVIGYTQRDFLFPGLFDDEHPVDPETQTVAVSPVDTPPDVGRDERLLSDRDVEASQSEMPQPMEDQGPAPDSEADLQDSDQATTDDEQLARWGRPPEQFGGNDVVKRTDRARAAFWGGDYDRAVILYQELIADYRNDPDLYGEMGNVYYAQGQWNEAAEAYYKAAKRLLERGQVSRAARLNRVIRSMDAEMADQLNRELAAVRHRNQ